MTLTEFLLARIAEDEAIWGGVSKRTPTTDLALAAGNWPDGESAILLTTNRHAAECDTKRRIVSLHSRSEGLYDQGVLIECLEGCIGAYPCKTLRLLALPYADHPDYLPEWRP
jgi:hypothetical protein